MGRLIFDISDDERAKLEAHRVRLGLRSLAEVIRHWINRGPDEAAEFVSRVESRIEQGARGGPAKRFTIDDVRPSEPPGFRLKGPKK